MTKAIIPLLLLAAMTAHAQSDSDTQPQLLDMYENADDDQEALLTTYDNMLELQHQPIDINRADADQLMSVPGMTAELCRHILDYRRKHGDIEFMEELRLWPKLELEQWQLLNSMLYVADRAPEKALGKSWLSNVMQSMHHDIYFTATQPLYYRAADMHAPQQIDGETNKYAGRYLGGRLKHSLRYKMAAGDMLAANLTAANTQGEPFLRAGNGGGYDAYAWNVVVRNLGIFSNITVGHFRAQFGMGLVLNNSFTLGKQAMMASASRSATGFTPHSSASDGKHMQGAAATFRIGDVKVAAFFSHRNIDATLNADSTISAIQTSGYHRTEAEMLRKNNSRQTTGGLHVGYSHLTRGGVSYGIGISALLTSLSRDINPVYSSADTISRAKLYRRYYPTGRRFQNFSADYNVAYGQFALTGETAVNENGALATLNSLLYMGLNRITLNLSQRYYAYDYYSLYGAALSEGGSVQNESAVLLGVRWTPSRAWTVEGYTDVAYFPWMKYRVSGASYAWDNSLSMKHRHGRWTVSARYRIKMRQRDESFTDDDGTTSKALTARLTQRMRLTAAMRGTRWGTRSSVEGILLSGGTGGIIVSQSASYRLLRGLKLYASGAFFCTDDYDSRLYAYEQGMRYTFASTSYFGRGMRWAGLVTWSPLRWLDVRGKIGYTKYFDRDNISSGERMISGSYMTDVDVQLGIKL